MRKLRRLRTKLKHLLQRLLKKLHLSRDRAIQIVVVAAVAITGGYIALTLTHADSYTGSTEAESGQLAGGATTIADTTASGGQAVQFGSSSSTGGAGDDTGFITAQGGQLMQNGKPYYSVSFDFIPVGACNWSGNDWTQSDMTTFFSNIPKNSMARVIIPPGDVPASFVQQLVQAADADGDHLIIALAHGIVSNQCDTQDAASDGSGKTATYYTTDALKTGGTYYNWVNSVVKPLANDPGIAIWEVINEPISDAGGQQATLNDVGGVSGFTNYVNGAAKIVRDAESAGSSTGQPRQLVSIAPDDMNAFGGDSGMKSIYANLDVLDLHDYSGDLTGNAVYDSFADYASLAKSMGKPFMVDEAGIEAGDSCNSPIGTVMDWDNGDKGLSRQNRVTFLLTQKATSYFNSGMSAIDFWAYQTGASSYGCIYENIDASDPLMAAAKSYQLP